MCNSSGWRPDVGACGDVWYCAKGYGFEGRPTGALGAPDPTETLLMDCASSAEPEEPLKPGVVVGREKAVEVPAAAMSDGFRKVVNVALTYPRYRVACKSALIVAEPLWRAPRCSALWCAVWLCEGIRGILQILSISGGVEFNAWSGHFSYNHHQTLTLECMAAEQW